MRNRGMTIVGVIMVLSGGLASAVSGVADASTSQRTPRNMPGGVSVSVSGKITFSPKANTRKLGPVNMTLTGKVTGVNYVHPVQGGTTSLTGGTISANGNVVSTIPLCQSWTADPAHFDPMYPPPLTVNWKSTVTGSGHPAASTIVYFGTMISKDGFSNLTLGGSTTYTNGSFGSYAPNGGSGAESNASFSYFAPGGGNCTPTIKTITFVGVLRLGGPVINGVTFGGSPNARTVTVSGSGFGTQAALGAPVTPCDPNGPVSGADFANNLYLIDSTGGWTAGQGTAKGCDYIGLVISSYTDSQIVFTLGTASPAYGSLNTGDSVRLYLFGSNYQATVS